MTKKNASEQVEKNGHKRVSIHVLLSQNVFDEINKDSNHVEKMHTIQKSENSLAMMQWGSFAASHKFSTLCEPKMFWRDEYSPFWKKRKKDSIQINTFENSMKSGYIDWPVVPNAYFGPFFSFPQKPIRL